MDIFDNWFEQLPEERKFTITPLANQDFTGYDQWMGKHGLARKKNIKTGIAQGYDLFGAYRSGQNPDKAGHLGSFGLGGKLLKHPEYPTAWKTAFVEIYHAIMGEYTSPDELGLTSRKDAAEYIQFLNEMRDIGY